MQPGRSNRGPAPQSGRPVNTWHSRDPANLPPLCPHPTTGKVTVFHLGDGESLEVEPIDAKELLASGAYSLTAPTITTE